MARQLSPLGAQIDKRRAELDLDLREVADAAGLSIEALRAVRYGENEHRTTTLGGVDRALRWKPGSAEAFAADGTPPVPLDGPHPVPDRATAVAAVFPHDTVAQSIMAQEHKTQEEREEELGDWLNLRRNRAQRALQSARNKRATITRFW
jgi:hypothetical protein